MNAQRELKTALIKFLDSGVEDDLALILSEHPEIVGRIAGDYPDLHRIADIRIGGCHYRVCRQISAGERLMFSPIDEALGDPGVPMWLEGERLRSWAKSEEDEPSDGPTDWESFR